MSCSVSMKVGEEDRVGTYEVGCVVACCEGADENSGVGRYNEDPLYR